MKKKRKKALKNFIELMLKALLAIAAVINAIAQLIEALK